MRKPIPLKKQKLSQGEEKEDSRLIKLILFATLIITPLIYAKFQYNPVFIINLKRLAFNLLTFFAVIILALQAKGKYKEKPSQLDIPIFIFVIICGISVVTSINRPVSFISFLNFTIQALFYFLLSIAIKGRDDIEKIVDIVIIISAVEAFYSIGQHYGFDILNLKVYQSGEASATFVNWNLMGGLFIYCFPLNLYKIISSQNIRRVLYYGFTIIVIITSLVLSKGRGNWLAVMIGTTLFAGLLFIKRIEVSFKIMLYTFIPILLSLIFVIIYLQRDKKISVYDRMSSIVDSSDPSIKQRIVMYQTALDIIKDYPVLGSGIDTYKIIHPNYQGKYFKDERYRIFNGLSLYAHNDYLQLCSEIGILGGSVFLWIIGTVYIIGFKGINQLNAKDNKSSLLMIAILSSFAAILIHSFFHYSFYMPDTGMLYWLTFGMIRNLSLKKEGKSISIPFYFEMAIVGASIFAAIFFLRLFIGNIYCESGYEYAQEGDNIKAIKDYEGSIDYNPWHADTYYFNGNSYFLEKNREKAEEMYKKALSYNPFFPHVYNKLGELYFQEGDLKTGEEMYTKAIDINPNFDVALFNLGLLYNREERYENAITSIKEALKLSPEYDIGHNILGNIYFKTGDIDNAVFSFQKAININPDYPDPYKNLGVIYAYNKTDYNKTLFYWSRYVELNPKGEQENNNIRLELERLKIVTNNH